MHIYKYVYFYFYLKNALFERITTAKIIPYDTK